MACADTGLFVYCKWNRATISRSGYWKEGSPADVGVPGDIWGGHKGYRQHVSACQLQDYCGWNNWYDAAGNWLPKPVGCGGTGPNQIVTPWCQRGMGDGDRSLLIQSEEIPTDGFSYEIWDETTLTKTYFNALGQPVGHTTFTGFAMSPSGYFSDKVDGITYTYQKPLTVWDVWNNACKQSYESANPADAFCNNIRDESGTLRHPRACGGTDPDIFHYDAYSEAAGNIGTAAYGLADDIAAQTDAIIEASKKKITGAAGVFLLLALLVVIIWFVL